MRSIIVPVPMILLLFKGEELLDVVAVPVALVVAEVVVLQEIEVDAHDALGTVVGGASHLGFLLLEEGLELANGHGGGTAQQLVDVEVRTAAVDGLRPDGGGEAAHLESLQETPLGLLQVLFLVTVACQ